jgi:hypothetical protein
MNSLWISIASVLAVFDISKAVSPTGKQVEPAVDFAQGSVQ